MEEVRGRCVEGVRDMRHSLRSWLWRVPLEQEFDEEIALHVEMRTRELIESGMDAVAARAEALRRMGDMRRLKADCVDLGRKRDREMALTLCVPAVARRAGLHARGDLDAGARHRRQQRDLRAGRRDVAAPVALSGSGSARHDLGEVAGQRARIRVAAEHARLEFAQPHLR